MLICLLYIRLFASTVTSILSPQKCHYSTLAKIPSQSNFIPTRFISCSFVFQQAQTGDWTHFAQVFKQQVMKLLYQKVWFSVGLPFPIALALLCKWEKGRVLGIFNNSGKEQPLAKLKHCPTKNLEFTAKFTWMYSRGKARDLVTHEKIITKQECHTHIPFHTDILFHKEHAIKVQVLTLIITNFHNLRRKISCTSSCFGCISI